MTFYYVLEQKKKMQTFFYLSLFLVVQEDQEWVDPFQ